MRFQYLALAAALAGSAVASTADAAQTLRIQGNFETLNRGSGIGPAPVGVDLTFNITSSASSGQVRFFASTITGTIGGQAYSPYNARNVATLQSAGLVIDTDGYIANGDYLHFYLVFQGPNAMLLPDYMTSANLTQSSIFFYSPTISGLGGYTDFRIASITSVGSVPGTNGVPEPSSWALMLVGFGVAGAAMRGRSKVRHTVSFA